ncbi:MAG: PEGA domain-containing protein [Acidobacteriota bacterium]|nr:PEGA domain-containing protein [Acidobacteriota bacterium]
MNPRRVSFLIPAVITAVVALWPAEAAAQRRVVRRAPTRVVVGVGAQYGYPIYAPYFYDPFWWGVYDYQFRRYPPYGYGGYYDASADLRIQVTPKQAEVYIDGYLTGTVDDFDGVFQRLHMPLGEHEITIYASGYRSITQRMLFRPFDSYTIKDTMQPLAAGDAGEPRPAPSETMRLQGPPPPRGGPPAGRPGDRAPDRDIDRGGDRFGAVAVRVQPADAEVLIDGERWEATGGDRVLVQLSEGTHRVEIRKSGYRSYTSTVRVRSGETVTLNVSLTAGE